MRCGEYKLDLGCGINKPEGFLGIDLIGDDKVDIVYDIDKHGLPFCDNSVIIVRSFSFFEHLENFIFVMNECWRVLQKEKGYLEGKVPNVGSMASYRDPTHRRFFVKDSFKYFDYLNANKYRLYKIKPWIIVKVETIDSRSEKDALISFQLKPYK